MKKHVTTPLLFLIVFIVAPSTNATTHTWSVSLLPTGCATGGTIWSNVPLLTSGGSGNVASLNLLPDAGAHLRCDYPNIDYATGRISDVQSLSNLALTRVQTVNGAPAESSFCYIEESPPNTGEQTVNSSPYFDGGTNVLTSLIDQNLVRPHSWDVLGTTFQFYLQLQNSPNNRRGVSHFQSFYDLTMTLTFSVDKTDDTDSTLYADDSFSGAQVLADDQYNPVVLIGDRIAEGMLMGGTMDGVTCTFSDGTSSETDILAVRSANGGSSFDHSLTCTPTTFLCNGGSTVTVNVVLESGGVIASGTGVCQATTTTGGNDATDETDTATATATATASASESESEGGGSTTAGTSNTTATESTETPTSGSGEDSSNGSGLSPVIGGVIAVSVVGVVGVGLIFARSSGADDVEAGADLMSVSMKSEASRKSGMTSKSSGKSYKSGQSDMMSFKSGQTGISYKSGQTVASSKSGQTAKSSKSGASSSGGRSRSKSKGKKKPMDMQTSASSVITRLHMD